ncbi:MAG: hypothetical protein ABFC38_12085 [Methanospirillum sp.]
MDIVRRKYLRQLADRTGRNTVLLYSCWPDRLGHPGTSIGDVDKVGPMTVVGGLDPGLGLDPLIHMPGGDTAATGAIACDRRALRLRYPAIVPQLALAAATVLCCAARVVMMGIQSSLGPIDPRVNNRPAYAVVEEFNRTGREMKEEPRPDPALAAGPRAVRTDHGRRVREGDRLVPRGRLRPSPFGHVCQRTRRRHPRGPGAPRPDRPPGHDGPRAQPPIETVREKGLAVPALKDDPALHDAVLSVHNAALLTFTNTPVHRPIENQDCLSFILGDAPTV